MVVPARNEEAAIGDCLDSILTQDVSNLEVIVVDGASRDRTASLVTERAAADPRVKLLSNPDLFVPAALNLALNEAKGKWFVRVDAHSRIPPGYVRRVVERLDSDFWGGVGGRKDARGTTEAGRAIAVAMGSRFGVGDSVYHYGTVEGPVDHIPFGAYPTELARRLGGWNEKLVVNQDFEFDFRVRQDGRQLLFDPTLRIEWQCQDSIRKLFDQYHRYGKGKAKVALLHPRSLQLRHLAAPILVASWAAAGALWRKSPALTAAIVAPYPIAVLTATIANLGKLETFGQRVRLPLAFCAMHSGWGTGFWIGLWKHGLEYAFEKYQPQRAAERAQPPASSQA